MRSDLWVLWVEGEEEEGRFMKKKKKKSKMRISVMVSESEEVFLKGKEKEETVKAMPFLYCFSLSLVLSVYKITIFSEKKPVVKGSALLVPFAYFRVFCFHKINSSKAGSLCFSPRLYS